jgi:hypothetical protein
MRPDGMRVYTQPRAFLRAVPRKTRHEAWAVIFARLGAETMAERVRIARTVTEALVDYHHRPVTPPFSGAPKAKLEKWFHEWAEVIATIERLRDEQPDAYAEFHTLLLGLDQPDMALRMADALEETAALPFETRSRGRPPENFDAVIRPLGALYEDMTGKRPGRGPGPFCRTIMAACIIGKIPKTEEAVVRAIKSA